MMMIVLTTETAHLYRHIWTSSERSIAEHREAHLDSNAMFTCTAHL